MTRGDVYAVSRWELRPLPTYGAALFYLSYLPTGQRVDTRHLGCALTLQQLLRLRKDVETAIAQLHVRAAASG